MMETAFLLLGIAIFWKLSEISERLKKPSDPRAEFEKWRAQFSEEEFAELSRSFRSYIENLPPEKSKKLDSGNEGD